MITRLITILLAALLSACINLRPAKTPMDTLTDVKGAPAERVLLVLLPGAYDLPKDYFTYGFVDEIRRRGLPVDIVAADAHVNYYTGQNVVERLHEDVIAPYRALGYRRIWLAGISLGGFGSLLYVHSHPGTIEGVLLLAPYLGSRSQVRDIGRAGGLVQWKPARDRPLDEETEMLEWLGGLLRSGAGQPDLYLGYGASDRFAPAIRVLAEGMRAERVIEVPGGHDWPTWSTLWRLMMDREPFTGRAPLDVRK